MVSHDHEERPKGERGVLPAPGCCARPARGARGEGGPDREAEGGRGEGGEAEHSRERGEAEAGPAELLEERRVEGREGQVEGHLGVATHTRGENVRPEANTSLKIVTRNCS